MRGQLAELLAKAIDRHALDQAMPKDELELFRQFLGALCERSTTRATTRRRVSGYSIERRRLRSGAGAAAGAGVQGPRAVAARSALPYLFEHIWDMQATMLQPVGGMDRIAHAIYEQVKPRVRLNTPVTAIRRVGRSRSHRAWPGQAGHRGGLLRLHAGREPARQIPNDFSPAKKAALKKVEYLPT